MSEVKRWEPRNTAFGYDMQPLSDGSFVLFDDFDRVTAERAALQQRLTAADELADKNATLAVSLAADKHALGNRVDVLEGLLRTSIIAMKRIYQAGYDRIIAAGGTCDTPEYMMQSDPTVRDIRAALKPAEGGGDA